MTSKAVVDERMLQHGDYNNVFYNVTLPDNEVTLIRPPIGDLDFQEDEYWILKKTLYRLRRSPPFD